MLRMRSIGPARIVVGVVCTLSFVALFCRLEFGIVKLCFPYNAAQFYFPLTFVLFVMVACLAASLIRIVCRWFFGLLLTSLGEVHGKTLHVP